MVEISVLVLELDTKVDPPTPSLLYIARVANREADSGQSQRITATASYNI